MSAVHIRLASKGWAKFTGQFGEVPFENGVSTRACLAIEVDRLAAITKIETVEGDAVGILERLKGGATLPAPIVAPLATLTEAEKAKEDEKAAATPEAAGKPPVEIPVYTVEDLHKVADEKGIAGLRTIAQPRGVKGRAIEELIGEILKEQAARLGTGNEGETPTVSPIVTIAPAA